VWPGPVKLAAKASHGKYTNDTDQNLINISCYEISMGYESVYLKAILTVANKYVAAEVLVFRVFA